MPALHSLIDSLCERLHEMCVAGMTTRDSLPTIMLHARMHVGLRACPLQALLQEVT
jgi:hypothetical protein